MPKECLLVFSCPQPGCRSLRCNDDRSPDGGTTEQRMRALTQNVAVMESAFCLGEFQVKIGTSNSGVSLDAPAWLSRRPQCVDLTPWRDHTILFSQVPFVTGTVPRM